MLAIIPARGGSKGLPKKNIRSLAGKPLIIWTIEAAQKSQQIDHIVLSTDDKEIADICRPTGIDIPFMRPVELAGDNSMAMDAYLYTIDKISQESKQQIGSFTALLPTVPLRLSADIDSSIELFECKDADSVISVTESSVPVDLYRKINKQGVLCDYFPDSDAMKNRQEFAKTYIPNGAVFVFRTERLRSTRNYYMERTYPYIMPRKRSIDIDSELDFELAEFLIAHMD